MKVVFLQDVANVAGAGEVKNVADGYARNFLLPKKLAVLATPAEMEKVEQRRKAEARQQAQIEEQAESIAEALNNLTLTFQVRAGAKERIYGSITSADIARKIKEESGQDIDRRNVLLDEPIRELGTHKVRVRLTRNVSAEVTAVVEQEQETQEKETK